MSAWLLEHPIALQHSWQCTEPSYPRQLRRGDSDTWADLVISRRCRTYQSQNAPNIDQEVSSQPSLRSSSPTELSYVLFALRWTKKFSVSLRRLPWLFFFIIPFHGDPWECLKWVQPPSWQWLLCRLNPFLPWGPCIVGWLSDSFCIYDKMALVIL